MSENNQNRHFAPSSLTPSNKYKSEIIGGNPGSTVIHNNYFVNYNGTLNLNNQPPPQEPQLLQVQNHQIQQQQQPMKKVGNIREPHVRISQEHRDQSIEEKDNEMYEQPNKSQMKKLQLNQAQKSKTSQNMLPKKLLKQAKSAKNARITPKGIIQKTAKAAAVNHNQQQNASIHQTGRAHKNKTQSQFDFNFTKPSLVKSRQNQNITIDYEGQRKGSQVVSGQEVAISGRTTQTRRQNSYSINNLPNSKPKTKQIQNQTQKLIKSGRSMAQTKQTQTFTKHKRHKSEVKRPYPHTRPVTKVNTLLKQVNYSQNKKTNKENNNDTNFSGERNTTTDPHKVTSQNAKSAHNKNQEGLSISSFSSRSNKGKISSSGGGHYPQNYNTNTIAEQLCKNYFLNSKQLLRHLSPNRFDQERSGSGRQNSGGRPKCPATSLLGGAGSGLSHRQQKFRGRTRSIAVATSNAPKPQRKTHSHSNSRTQNAQQLQTLRNNPQLQSIIVNQQKQKNIPPPSSNATAAAAAASVPKSKSANCVQQQNRQLQSHKQQLNKTAVDKLIKDNIRKKKSKYEEEYQRKQIEENRQKQRKAELTQRNQEVRMINASKIVNHGGVVVSQQQNMGELGSGEIRQSAQDPSQRKRSQSCIDYSNKKAGNSNSEERRAHHSQGNRYQQPSSQINQNQQPPKPKQIPRTTTNKLEKNKPRSFVNEINMLTQLVEQEIGHDQQRSSVQVPSGRPLPQQKTPAPRMSQKHRNNINETAQDSHSGDRTVLSAQQPLNYTSLVQSSGQQTKIKKKERASVEIQKFIERKKREEFVKKSLEQTIEVDKHIKIQKNLNNLDRYAKKNAKKNTRQRSQPAIASKKPGQIKEQTKNFMKKSRKSKAGVDQPMSLSGIFHPVYPQADSNYDQSPIRRVNENSIVLDQEGVYDHQARGPADFVNNMSKNNSALGEYPNEMGQRKKGGQSKQKQKSKSNIPLSTKAAPKPRKTYETTQFSNGTHPTSAGRGELGSNFKNLQNSGPTNLQLDNQGLIGSQPISYIRQRKNSDNGVSQNLSEEQPTWLALKHPENEIEDDSSHVKPFRGPAGQRRPAHNLELENDTPNINDINQMTWGSGEFQQSEMKGQQQLNNFMNNGFNQSINFNRPDNANSRLTPTDVDQVQHPGLDPNNKLSPKSTEHIRRVHELVALYRCRLKPGVSDASVMGTLHSAASVIQIHYRYYRHLREAGLRKPSEYQPREVEEVEAPEGQFFDDSGYIDSDDQNQNNDPFNNIHVGGLGQLVESGLQSVDRDYIDTTDKRKQPSSNSSSPGPYNSNQGPNFQQRGSDGRSSNQLGMSVVKEGVPGQLSPEVWYHGDGGQAFYAEDDNEGVEVISDQFRDSSEIIAKGKHPIMDFYGNQEGQYDSKFSGSGVPSSQPWIGHGSEEISQGVSPPEKIVSRVDSMEHNQILSAVEHLEKKQKHQKAQSTSFTASQQQNQPIFINSKQGEIHHRRGPPASLPHLDIEAIESNNNTNQKVSMNDTLDKSPLDTQNSGTGQKTPQVPGLDLRQLRSVGGKSQSGKQGNKKEGSGGSDNQNNDVNQISAPGIQPGQESPNSYSGHGEPQQTASSYSGIFNRLGLPLPRSARVKVEYGLVQKDPRISEQLREIIHFKEMRGKQVMDEGRRDNLITERTYDVNRKKLEKWVSTSYNKIEENQMQRSSRRSKIATHEELLRAAEDGRVRLQKIINSGDAERQSARSGRPSGRSALHNQSYKSQSGRGQPGYGNPSNYNQYPSARGVSHKDEFTDRDRFDHYGQPNIGMPNHNIGLGSARHDKSKLVELIHGDSSNTSSKPKRESGSDSRKNQGGESSSYHGPQDEEARLEDIQLQIEPNRGRGPTRFSEALQMQPENPNNSVEDSPQAPTNELGSQERDKIGFQDEYMHLMQARDTQGPTEDEDEKILSDGAQGRQYTDKSLNRSQSYPSMMQNDQEVEFDDDKEWNDDNIGIDNSGRVAPEGFKARRGSPVLYPDQIELQLEDALRNEQRKNEDSSSPELKSSDIQRENKPAIEAIRDPWFFTRQVEEDGKSNRQEMDTNFGFGMDTQFDQDLENQAEKATANNAKKGNELLILDQSSDNELRVPNNQESTAQNSDKMARASITSSEGMTKEQTGINLSNMNEEEEKTQQFIGNSSYMDSSQRSPNTTQKIKVENQREDDNLTIDQPDLSKGQNKLADSVNRPPLSVETIDETSAPGHPVSPVSDQAFESKIQTGAHSLSSTDSDMTKAIHAAHTAHKESLDSPPDVMSPKSNIPITLDSDEGKKQELADQIADEILIDLLGDSKGVLNFLDQVIPRQNAEQVTPQRQGPTIKFFEKKGIKTDLFAIEKYVDEVLDEVKENRPEFMGVIGRPLTKDAQETLFRMQNSEIGSYEHFNQTMPPVLALELYLKLEKRRKESREAAQQQNDPQLLDGQFDFERVNEDELHQDGVDKNFLAECQHIHNKVLFDCINDSLQQFRPHGKDGAPMAWSRLGRKLKPTEDFTLEEMFQITQHDLFRMAIMQAGTLPRREFVFGGQFDEDLFAEIREKKLATLLCREIVETEPQWLKWDFEEAQTKVDISDMILEQLVVETVELLNNKKQQQNSAQAQFEQIQQMLQNNS